MGTASNKVKQAGKHILRHYSGQDGINYLCHGRFSVISSNVGGACRGCGCVIPPLDGAVEESYFT